MIPMLNVCIIGIGNCGNQIADLAFREKHIPGVAINSSSKDLQNVKSIPKLTIGDEKGAGKDRMTAKTFVKEKVKTLLSHENLNELIEPQDVVFVVSSIGGGTGSGMAPMMTDILSRKYPNKRFIIIEVYAPIKESIGAQQNSIEFLEEVKSNLPNVTYMCYDNNRFANMSTSEMMERVNGEIIEHIDIIRGQYLYATPYNSIDEKDMLRFLTTAGRLAIYDYQYFNEKDLDSSTIEETLIDIIKNESANVEIERDKIIKRFGVITNLNERLNKEFNSSCDKVKELIGEPIESFEHIYITNDKDEDNRVILILSGLSIPDDRIMKITQRINEGLEELGKQKESSILDELEYDNLKDLRKDENTNTSLDLDDVFSKFM